MERPQRQKNDLRRCFIGKSALWYLIAIIGPAAILVAAAILEGNLKEQLMNLSVTPALITTLIMYLVAAIPEEVARRGFAQPRLPLSILLARYSIPAEWHRLRSRFLPHTGRPRFWSYKPFAPQKAICCGLLDRR